MRALIVSRSRWFRLALLVVVALGSTALAWGIVWWTGGTELGARVVSAAPQGEDVGRLTPVAIRIEGEVDRQHLRDSLTISPAVAGTADWKDDALVFQPQWPGYARGTTYSVELAARGGLKEPLSFSFAVEGKLAVSMVVPTDETPDVPLDGALLVQFNRPVAPITVLEEEAPQKDVLHLEPAVEGSGKWLNSTTYIFRPATTWAPATAYVATVPAGVSDTLGAALEVDYTWRFTTIFPAVSQTEPAQNTQYVGPNQEVKVVFNQPVDPASAEEHFSLVAEGTSEPVVGSFSWPDDRTFVFQPTEPLLLATRYQATLAPGTAALGQPAAVIAEPVTWSFTTAGQPRVTYTNPSNGTTQAELTGVEIRFAHPMDEQSVENAIVVSPQAEEDQSYSYWDESSVRLFLYFPQENSTAYTVTIPAGVKDRYGQAMAQDFVLSFSTRPREPGLYLIKPYGVAALSAYGEQQVAVRSWNISSMEFALYTLDKQTLMDYAADWGRYENLHPPASSLLHKWSQDAPASETNESVLTVATLAAADGGRLAAGYYFLTVSPAGSGQRDALLLVVTRTHLLVKRSENQVMAWAVDLASGEPQASLPVSVYQQTPVTPSGPFPAGVDYQLRKVAGGSTDADGVFLATLDENLERWNAMYVEVERPEDAALASTEWNNGIDPWQFHLMPDYDDRPYRGYIYTDRPVYRPGQTVYYKGIVRRDNDANYELPPLDVEGTITISDAMGRQVDSQTVTLNDFGAFDGQLVLSTEAATGAYYVRLQMERDEQWQSTADASFEVAEYRKPEFEVKVTPDKEDYINGDEITVEVDASYFFGAPVNEAPVEWRLSAREYAFADPQERPYIFTDYDLVYGRDYYWGESPPDIPRADGTAETDAEGKLTLHLPADVSTDPTSQVFTIEATVTDINHQQVSGRAEVVVHKGNLYIGLRPRSYVATAGEAATLDILTLDTQGEVAADVPLTVSVYQRKWTSVKERDPSGEYYWRSEPEDTLVETLSARTGADGEGSLTFTPPRGGSYRLVAEAVDSAGNRVQSATYLWVAGAEYIPWRVDTDDRIELVADKRSYAPGETAKILVPAPFDQSRGLLTIERGRIIEHRLADFPTNSTVLELPITSAHVPNVFVSVALFKPPTDENPVPSFKVGYVELQVANDEKKVNISIEASSEEVHPRDSVSYTIATTDSAGQPLAAEVSLALVDVAVLTLADDTSAAPLKAFYNRRGIGVMTGATQMVSLDRINQLGGANPRQSGGKGGGGGGGTPGEVRRFFPDTAYWNPSLRTDETGQASVTVQLPDNLTTWRLTAKAATQATQVGDATNEIVAAKELLIRPVTPRFFVVGDTPRLEAIVHNYGQETAVVLVKLSADGLTLDTASRLAVVEPGEAATVAWDTTVGLADQATLTFSAEGSGGLSDSVELTLPVYVYGTEETVGNAGEVQGAVKEVVQIPPYVLPDRGELTVELSPSLAASMNYSLSYVEEYPYECVEQTTSRFLPRLLLHRTIKKLGLPDKQGIGEELPGIVSRSIQRLYNYQNPDGGWGWWGSEGSSPQMTAYALFGLAEASKDGFAVDENVMQRASQFLNDYLNWASDVRYPQSPNVRAFTLFVMADAGFGDLGMANALAEQSEGLSSEGKAFTLMAILEQTDDPSNLRVQSLMADLTGSAVVSNTGAHWEGEMVDKLAMSTTTRATAVVLAALIRVQADHPLVEGAARWLMVARREGRWETTQETALSMLALTDLMAARGELKADYAYQVQANGRVLAEEDVDVLGLTDSTKVVVPMQELRLGEDNEVLIARSPQDAAGRLYYTMHLRYFPPATEVEAANNGLAVAREFLPADGGEQGIHSAAVGDLVKVRLTVVAPTDLHYVVVEDFLPAGLEPVDASLRTTSQEVRDMLQQEQQKLAEANYDTYRWWGYPQSYFSHVDMRDNRVALFADYLPRGVHQYVYFLQATTSGEYNVLPARGYEMYFPEVWGRTDGGTFSVTSGS